MGKIGLVELQETNAIEMSTRSRTAKYTSRFVILPTSTLNAIQIGYCHPMKNDTIRGCLIISSKSVIENFFVYECSVCIIDLLIAKQRYALANEYLPARASYNALAQKYYYIISSKILFVNHKDFLTYKTAFLTFLYVCNLTRGSSKCIIMA